MGVSGKLVASVDPKCDGAIIEAKPRRNPAKQSNIGLPILVWEFLVKIIFYTPNPMLIPNDGGTVFWNRKAFKCNASHMRNSPHAAHSFHCMGSRGLRTRQRLLTRIPDVLDLQASFLVVAAFLRRALGRTHSPFRCGPRRSCCDRPGLFCAPR